VPRFRLQGTILGMQKSKNIVLATLNAKYIHTAFGLRYLKANLHEYEGSCRIQEFTVDVRVEDAVEQLLESQPAIIGFGVYIWNVEQTEKIVALLKTVAPKIAIVLGGPEVSYEQQEQPIVQMADHTISGWGESSFYSLVCGILDTSADRTSVSKLISGKQEKLYKIQMPYYLYDQEGLMKRIMYVEASRGCPYKCEFCLSSLDKTAWSFDIERFLSEMALLHARGARQFKFVDRTFNLKVDSSIRILEFFLERLDEDLFLHFEVIPDHLPDRLKSVIQKFPAASLQFEIGIQTFDTTVQKNISRRQNNEKAADNMVWIRTQSQAHIHADLIFGLPGETLESFSESFDRLVALGPHEIQLGILKRLRGSPIVRHTEPFSLRFSKAPPYSIVATDRVSFEIFQRVNRFARFWDLIGNSGRFSTSLPMILGKKPFERFLILSDSIFESLGRTHKIALIKLFNVISDLAPNCLNISEDKLIEALKVDHAKSGLQSLPTFLSISHSDTKKITGNRKRQLRHVGIAS
jgi:radical SAM superfamily enzyme YgiQ (UPF0313 family)